MNIANDSDVLPQLHLPDDIRPLSQPGGARATRRRLRNSEIQGQRSSRAARPISDAWPILLQLLVLGARERQLRTERLSRRPMLSASEHQGARSKLHPGNATYPCWAPASVSSARGLRHARLYQEPRAHTTALTN